jgi:hypothetical protein
MSGYLNAWIDYNQDKTWDDEEQIIKDEQLPAGRKIIPITISATAMLGTTSARFRFSDTQGLGPTDSTTFEQQLLYVGEVEDYNVEIIDGVTDVDALSEMPTDYKLYNNYPNPFNPATNIKFDVKDECHVKLSVYDAVGQFISLLVDENLPAGRYKILFNNIDLPSGVYIYRIRMGNYSDTKKMILLR